MRSCKYNTSPSPVNFNMITSGTKMGRINNRAKDENKTSKKRSKVTSFDLSFCQSLYEQNGVTIRKII